jgi:hypothetical protein
MLSKKEQERILKSSFCVTTPEWWARALAKVEDLPGEEWRQFRNTFYSVSNMGRVKRNRGEKLINGKIVFFEEMLMVQRKKIDKYGRVDLTVSLVIDGKRKTFFVSNLVAECFVPNDDPQNKIQINHKNENPLDNRAVNLEHCTPTYNANYGTRNQKISEKLTGKKYGHWSEERRRNISEGMKAVNSGCKAVVGDGVSFVSAIEAAEHFSVHPNTMRRWLSTQKFPEHLQKYNLRYS